MNKQKQAGFAVVEAVIIVTVLALVGGTGFWVFSHSSKKNVAATSTQSSQTTKSAAPSAAIDQSLTDAVAAEAADEDSGVSDVAKSIDAAAESTANVGESFNENSL